MNGNEQTPFGEHEDLRQLLDRPQARTRAPHDTVVLRAARTPHSHARRVAIPVTLAAALAILAVGLYLPSRVPHDDDAIVRSRSSIEGQSVSPAVGVSLTTAPVEFRWPAQAGARSYGLVLRDASGITIWRSDPLTTNHAPLDRALAEKLTSHTYYWSVEVEREEARLELGPFWFRLVDP
jgi:ferric-dicitrate binding protein FerR (iron transport regulator)